MLKGQVIPVTGYAQNCSIIWCDETMEGALVDPGGDVDVILRAVAKTGATLKKILLTHGHADHAGGAMDIAEKYDLPIIGPHKDDQFWLEGIEEAARSHGMAGLRDCTPTSWLEGGETIMVGNCALDVEHCPGHTPGHVVFINKKDQLAFVGDVIFQGSIGRTDFPKSNHQDLLDSIVQKLWPYGNDITFVPGHGRLSTFGKERQSNPYVADKIMAKT